MERYFPPNDTTNCFVATQLPQFCTHSQSVDFLGKITTCSCVGGSLSQNPYPASRKRFLTFDPGIILKINKNSSDLKHEYQVLKEFPEDYSVRVYEYDEAGQMLLEERILPGTELSGITDVNQRLDEFVKVFRNIHRQPEGNDRTYLDWLGKAYTYCCENTNDFCLTEKMLYAFRIGKELFEKYPDRVLLHGDLHHHNILCSSYRSSEDSDQTWNYKIIDPKGIVGPAVFDLPRFILNELDTKLNKTGTEHIRYVINRLADLLEYERADISKLFFMEVILANVWNLQDGKSIDEKAVSIALEIIRNRDVWR